MSLIAPLLSLPGRVRKLRSYNAVKLPAAGSIAPVVTESENASWELASQLSYQISRQPQAHETHFALLDAQNNAFKLSEPVCNITGKGVLYGAWIVYSGYLRASSWMKISANLIIDGIELIDQTWEYDTKVLDEGLTGLTSADDSKIAIKIPLLGTLKSIPFAYGATSTQQAIIKEYVPLLKPLRFDQSLEINLIHKESEALSTALDNVTARLCAAIYEDA